MSLSTQAQKRAEMEQITAIFEINWVQVVIGVFVALLAIKVGAESIKYVANLFGIELKSKREKEENRNMIELNANDLKELRLQGNDTILEIHKAISDVVSAQNKITEGQKDITDSISKSLDELRADMTERLDALDKRIENVDHNSKKNDALNARHRILVFNGEIRRHIDHTAEHFDQILSDIKFYEKYCAEHPSFQNDKAKVSIANIREVYEKCNKENKFL